MEFRGNGQHHRSYLKEYLFFLYTWTGCDTTPAIYGHGKTFLISKISSSQELHRYAELVN